MKGAIVSRARAGLELALEERAQLAELTRTKYVRVANEDDDRYRLVDVNGETKRDYANRHHLPSHESIRQRGLFVGSWGSPINRRLSDGAEVFHSVNDPQEDFAGQAGFFMAIYRASGNGTRRISCIGGDDKSYVREGMRPEVADRVWERLRDFVTIRTLVRRMGFHRE